MEESSGGDSEEGGRKGSTKAREIKLVQSKLIFRNNRNHQNFFKVAIIFFLQFTLLTCLLLYIIILPVMFEPPPNAEWEPDTPGHPYVPFVRIVTKFICCVLLHINM